MASFLDQIKAKTADAEAARKAEAEAKAEELRQEAVKKSADEARAQRVRDALHLSSDKYAALATQHKEELQGMVAANKEAVAGSLGEVSAALQDAETAGVEVSPEEAKGARIESIKGSTVEGLKIKRDEMRAAEAAGKMAEYVKSHFDELTEDEIKALEGGDMAAVKQSIEKRQTPEAKEKALEKEAENIRNDIEGLKKFSEDALNEIIKLKANTYINPIIGYAREVLDNQERSKDFKIGEQRVLSAKIGQTMPKDQYTAAYEEGLKADEGRLFNYLQELYGSDSGFKEKVQILLTKNAEFMGRVHALSERVSQHNNRVFAFNGDRKAGESIIAPVNFNIQDQFVDRYNPVKGLISSDGVLRSATLRLFRQVNGSK